MAQNIFYDKGVAKLREDYLRKNSRTQKTLNEFFFHLIFDAIRNDAYVLDVGTGNGYILENIKKLNKNRNLFLSGIDNSKEMLNQAKKISWMNINLVNGNNLALPFRANSFDIITAKNVTNFSESEIYRILKIGGKFFFKEYGKKKGLVEIANLFPERLIRSRDPFFYVNRLTYAGFKNINLKEYNLTKEYSLDELIRIMNMFPFLDHFCNEDINKIKKYFGQEKRKKICSDQIIIFCEKNE